MTNFQDQYQSRLMNHEALIGQMRPGNVISLGIFYGQPVGIMRAISEHARDIDPLTILLVQGTGMYDYYNHPGLSVVSGFLGPVERISQKAHQNVYFTPICFSDVYRFAREWRPFDYFCFRSTPMDERGYFNLSMANSWEYNAIRWISRHRPETKIVLEVNPNLPRVCGLPQFGNNEIHVSDVSLIVEDNTPIADFAAPPPGEREKAIAANVAALVEDKSTIQLGFGNIPMAIGNILMDRRDLGIHSEMFCEAHVDLIEAGAVSNACKGVYDGVSVATFVLGEQRMRKFLHENREFAMIPVEELNHVAILAKIKKMVGINSVIMVDLAGQACAHCIGSTTYSGVGGAFEFAYGSQLSEGGKSITCLPSTATLHDGRVVSNIVAQFEAGTRVTLPEHTTDWVVTENGAVRLKLLNQEERAAALIRIAHPDFREELSRQATAMGLRMSRLTAVSYAPETYFSISGAPA